jgi:hypothetical protein
MDEDISKTNFEIPEGVRILHIIFLQIRDDLSEPFITLANKSMRQIDITVPNPWQ